MALSKFAITKENTPIKDLITIICLIKWEIVIYILQECVSHFTGILNSTTNIAHEPLSLNMSLSSTPYMNYMKLNKQFK